MTYSFSPHLKRKKIFDKLHFKTIKNSVRKLILIEFDFPTHIYIVILKAKIKKVLKVWPYRLRHCLRQQKKTLALILLLLTFMGSVGWSFESQKRQEKKIEQYRQIKALESKIEEAISLMKLNPLKAKPLVEEIERELAVSERMVDREKVLGLKTKFEEFKAETFRLVDDKDFPTVYDFEYLRQKELFGSLVFQNSSLVVMDKYSGFIFKLNSETKNVETLLKDSEELKTLIEATSFGNRLFFLTRLGVYELENGFLKKIIEVDGQWQELKGISNYQGRSLYLLDVGAGKIWKYQEGNKGWGGKTSYYSSGKEVDLKSASNIAIDGNVWVSFEDGAVLKLLRGAREDFGLTGLEQPFGKNNQIYTNETVSSLYVLDRANNRLLIFSKLGGLLKQFSHSVFGLANSFTVSENENKIFFLVNKKVVSFEIK